jgi:hypothetical protein
LRPSVASINTPLDSGAHRVSHGAHCVGSPFFLYTSLLNLSSLKRRGLLPTVSDRLTS